jgi:nucleoside-diphosphate-sugar epimerase
MIDETRSDAPMKILVTGSSGKLGTWAVRELKSRQHVVIGFDRVGSREPMDREVLGDIEDLAAVSAALKGAEAILHLAGVPTHSILPDNETFRINAMGAFNVHEAARRANICRVVSVSSEAVLGWSPGSWEREHLPDYFPIDEKHVCEPQDCYGLSKVVLEQIGRTFTNRCGMVTVFLRASWIVSPRELEELARNNGRPLNSFTLFHYVDVRDVAMACRLALEVPLVGSHAFFIGSGETTVSEPLADLYPRLCPRIGDRAAGLTGKRGPVSTERARELLGWEPKHFWRGLKVGACS